MESQQELEVVKTCKCACRGTSDTRITVGLATCGIAAGARHVYDALLDEVKKRGLDNVKVMQTGCIGVCRLEPIVEVIEPGKKKVTYVSVTPDMAARIIEQHVVGGDIVKEFTVRLDTGGETADSAITSIADTEFYDKQRRIALRNCGIIDPESIEDYIATGGYLALKKALTEMRPADIIDTVKASGLRGRGGAGFPTGAKWSFAAAEPPGQKYICCNADEGDPGAFMDRAVLEGDPHSVIEAMIIAGYAIGAEEGYIYVRAEYPVAVSRLKIAIKQAEEHGFIGKNILNSGFDFKLNIRLGAGAFVCGEETALMTSIEGKRGEPHPRPPFPAVKGLFQRPTVLNNVETFANIPMIILEGPEEFASVGTEKSKGTKVFALGGKIKNTGLVEIPMGTTLRTIVEDIGGGVPNGKRFKAAQTGGPSGGCIPASHLDTPIEYESLVAIGSMMGSGGLIIMDEDNCMVDIAKFFLEFTVDESCGKCAPCRIGTKRLYEILEKITEGKGEMEDLELLEELAVHIKENSLCGLGQTAPNPVLSTMRYFKDEYIAHIRDRKCPAGVCKALLKHVIDPDKCVGCGLCAKNCPTGAITGKLKEKHVIHTDKCINCGVCAEKCKFGAISKG